MLKLLVDLQRRLKQVLKHLDDLQRNEKLTFSIGVFYGGKEELKLKHLADSQWKKELRCLDDPQQKLELRHQANPQKKLELRRRPNPQRRLELRCLADPQQRLELRCPADPQQRLGLRRQANLTGSSVMVCVEVGPKCRA
ncbi:hypothetical protein AMECASPLE_029731 [Ameca splendens]|uniref:Uncharacterized protein n=1 Tax=Ameca splendens TaxID=208324 RepID=A0ABV0ZQQ7_9TELE